MPKALGRRMTNHKPLLAVAASVATVGWVAGSAVDPPRAVPLALVGVGAVGTVFFSLRPLLRPRHSHSSLPLFPALVVA